MVRSAFNPARFLATLKTTKRWWIPLTVACIVLVNLAGLVLPKKYESKGVIRIHDPKLEKITTGATDVLKIGDRLKTIRDEITSYSFLKGVAHSQNLDYNVAPDSPQYDKLIAKMREAIDLQVREEQNLFVVIYVADTPEKARDVTEAIVDRYIENSNRFYNVQTKSNEGLIQTQLDDAKRKLDQAQLALMEYKNAHINEIPEAQEEHMRRLGQLRADLQTNSNQLDALRDSQTLARQKLAKMDRDIVSETLTQESPELIALRNQKQAEELKLNSLLQDFTEEHWQVKQSRAQLKLLEQQLKLAQSNQAQQVKKSPSQAYQALQDTVLKNELEEKKLASQVTQLTKMIQTLEKYLNNIPKHQGELERLQNTRRLSSERVEALMKMLDEAKITGAIEQQGLGPSFEVMDHPRAVKTPVSPKREKIVAASLVLGLGAGLALVYLLTLLDSAVRSMDEVRQLLQMPVLGVMQRIVTASEEARQKRRRRRQAFGLSAGLTLLVVMVILGLAFYREPLQNSVESVRNFINQW